MLFQVHRNNLLVELPFCRTETYHNVSTHYIRKFENWNTKQCFFMTTLQNTCAQQSVNPRVLGVMVLEIIHVRMVWMEGIMNKQTLSCSFTNFL